MIEKHTESAESHTESQTGQTDSKCVHLFPSKIPNISKNCFDSLFRLFVVAPGCRIKLPNHTKVGDSGIRVVTSLWNLNFGTLARKVSVQWSSSPPVYWSIFLLALSSRIPQYWLGFQWTFHLVLLAGFSPEDCASVLGLPGESLNVWVCCCLRYHLARLPRPGQALPLFDCLREC